MKRWIYTYRYVHGDPDRVESTFLDSCADLLRLATAAPDDGPSGDGSFLVEIESHVAGVHLAKQIRVQSGVASRRDGGRVVLPMQWHADPARWFFPAFVGAMEWEPLDRDLGQLTLAGSYETPFGVVGTLVDASLLRDVAHRTADQLLSAFSREVARALTAEPVAEAPRRGRRHGPMHVRDVMTPDPLLLDESLPLRTAALILFHAGVSGAPVVTADGSLVGVLSESDLLAKEADERFGWSRAAEAEDRKRRALSVGEASSAPARVTAPDARLSAAARQMLDHDVSRLVVVGEGRIAGIISRHDVLAALIRDDRELLAEVRLQLDVHGASGVAASVEWGQVRLTGTTRLRTTAAMLARLVESIDGVVAVDDDDLTWVEDDVLPKTPPVPL